MQIAELVTLIQSALPSAEVYARDLTGAGDHFEAFVVSDAFQGKSRVQRQQLAMAPLLEVLKGPLHALTLKTFTQAEWASAQEKG